MKTIPTSSTKRNLQQEFDQQQKMLCRPEAHCYVLSRMDTVNNSDGKIPSRITLLRPNPQNNSQDQLFLDHTPLPRDTWSYDAHDRALIWTGAYGGGHLLFTHAGPGGGTGAIGSALNSVSVVASSTANFLCNVALNTGATPVTSGGIITGFNWDPSSAKWTTANWIAQRLLLSYTVTPGGPMNPPIFSFTFTDKETGAIPWTPGSGNSASLTLAQSPQGLMVWDLTFLHSAGVPAAEQGGNPPKANEPDTVYPYLLNVIEDAAAQTLTGVMMIDDTTVKSGVLVGLSGARQSALATGYYQAAANAAPFGIFDGKMAIDGKSVPDTYVDGLKLCWSKLPLEIQQRTGLSANGSANFQSDGSVATNDAGTITLRRLSSSLAIGALAAHADIHPQIHQQTQLFSKTLQDPSLTITGLLAMTPYVQNGTTALWYDAVQAAVTSDLNSIMNSFVPSAMWDLLFPHTPQPTLTGELAIIAASPVSGVTNPEAWYQSLATAVMTAGMANGSDVNCHNMNGARASQWLKSQVATSKVYYAHSQLLFQYEWAQRFPLISSYLSNQINNASAYQLPINNQIALSIIDITANVAPDPSDPTLISKLTDQVKAVGQYAINNNLYWAFAYFTYNTNPAILANIAMQMGIQTGSSDGTTLTRLFQQNISVLTALDSSGYFAQQYTKTINIFMATNILPSMFGFLGDANSFSIIKLYLQNFVTNNLSSEDAKIAAAAAQIQAILQDRDADKMLQDSIEMLRTLSGATEDAMALPIIANKFVTWFSQAYPRFSKATNAFGSIMIGGMAALGIVNLITGFKQWDKLTPAEQSQLIINASQIGLQIVAAVVKRGIRVYSMFGVDGLSTMQRAASISRIMATGGEDAFDTGLTRIGNATARWLSSTEGSLVSGADFVMVLENVTTASAEDVTLLAKVMGKNLDEFIGTRIGPIFILAGIGYSIYNIAHGEGTIEEASDALNIVSGSLMLIAIAGSFAVEGSVFAGIAAVAGPLAIVAALAGVALMIYEMCQTPPDPVQTFVDTYVKPAGFYIGGLDSSIDYVAPYINPDQANLLMIGFTLGSANLTLTANNNGSISLGAASALPNCVWQVQTDALGMSQIFTLIQPDASSPPTIAYLSLMSDQTVSFQPKKSTTPPASGPSITTQTWLSTPIGNAVLTSTGNYLVALNLALQAVIPDAQGNYLPVQAAGYLIQGAAGVSYANSGGTTFTLKMAGMAPNYMTMRDVKFILNSTPSTTEAFRPSFGIPPSTPVTFTLTPALPAFLTFNNTGTLAPNGGVATPASSQSMTVVAQNILGQAQAGFTISVA